MYQLEPRDPHSHALTLEWLDLALGGLRARRSIDAASQETVDRAASI